MKWEDYNPMPVIMERYVKTDIECPQCGAKLLKRTDVVLTTYPPKYGYKCTMCGFYGTKFG